MPQDARPVAVASPWGLHSAKLGLAIVALLSVVVIGVELWLLLTGFGEVIRLALLVGLLWALWRGHAWARILSGALLLLGGAMVGSGWPAIANVALGLALLLVPGVGAFQAERRQRSAAVTQAPED